MKKYIKNPPHIISGVDQIKKNFPNKKIKCLTGIRPSWRLHLWHYLGALQNILELQKQKNIEINFLIADYQVLWDHLWETKKLRESVIDVIIDSLSIWINPKKINFIVQSYVPEFCELFNYLTMFSLFSNVISNPTLKDEMKKIKNRTNKNSKNISLWFINYPVSQIADILLLKSDIIPVWEDQIPHIELARKIIKKVNSTYETDFPLPISLLSKKSRLVWVDGNDKMSKSLGNAIYLSSTKEEIILLVNSMYTDPWKIAVSSQGNIEKHVVFQYLDLFYNDKKHLESLKDRYIQWWENSIWDGELKKLLIQTLEDFISPIRQKREYYKNNINEVIKILEKWSKKARKEGKILLDGLKLKMWVVNYGSE